MTFSGAARVQRARLQFPGVCPLVGPRPPKLIHLFQAQLPKLAVARSRKALSEGCLDGKVRD
jgi:hypothetical protein